MIKCTFLLWLACFFISYLLAWEYHLNIHELLLLLGVACFSWSTLLIASTKHLKCSSDHHFHVSLLSTILGLPTHRRQAPTLGRSDLFPRIILDTHLKWICWLIQVMDLSWWVTFPSLSPFLFYVFKSFYQIIYNSH